MSIAIYTLTSALHDEVAVNEATREFLDGLGVEFEFKGSDYSSYGCADLCLIYVRTGGTEGVFRGLQDELLARSSRPFYLLTSGKANSLAASMEILSYLRQRGLKGEIIHGSADYVTARIELLARVEAARRKLAGQRLGIIGKPSDWLISSLVCPAEVKASLGIELVEIDIEEVVRAMEAVAEPSEAECAAYRELALSEAVRKSLPGALRMYGALKKVIADYGLNGFTIRCFDLLDVLHNTSCLALAMLNAEGFVAGCEGDVPTMLSMAICRAVTGVSGFQANPSRINPVTGEMLVAHCTIPLDMCKRYTLDTHFESGIGVGVHGCMVAQPVSIFKVSGDVKRHFVAEGELVRNLAEPNLCRTQQVIRLDDASQAGYFLTDPIGNHHVVVPGRVKAVLDELLG